MGSGKIAHEPECAATKIIAGERGHQKHDHRGEERSGDDAAEEERGAVNLAVATPEDVDRDDSDGGAEESADRSDQSGHFGSQIEAAPR